MAEPFFGNPGSDDLAKFFGGVDIGEIEVVPELAMGSTEGPFGEAVWQYL